jgi:septum formation protein
MFNEFPFHIILASASPRRKELLTQLGFSYKIEVKSVDELIPENLSPQEVALHIANQKIDAFDIHSYPNQTLIITADTVVTIDNKILGKPANEIEAKQMLQLLSGRKHEVITAVCLKTSSFHDSFYDITQVEFSDISANEIDYYINEFKPFDKAGAYGIQEWIGVGFIKSIVGSYTNVVGFPTELVRRKLHELI